jgi:anti-sigma factor RsiW
MDQPRFPYYKTGHEMIELQPNNLQCPTLMDLASYLDARLSCEDVALIERHLAECPACAEAVREYREMHAGHDSSMVFVPPHVLAGAMALVKAADARNVNHRLVFAQRAAAVAASIVIGVGGYQVGANLSAPQQVAAAESDSLTAADYSFGLLDSASTDDESDLNWLMLSIPEGES